MRIEITDHAMERDTERFWPRTFERLIRKRINGEVNYLFQKGRLTNRKPPTIDGDRTSRDSLYALSRGGRSYVLRAIPGRFLVVTVLRAA